MLTILFLVIGKAPVKRGCGYSWEYETIIDVTGDEPVEIVDITRQIVYLHD